MVNTRIATGAEQPINSDGAVSSVTLNEGDPVGLNSDGELIAADAATGTAVAAVGVAAVPVDDHSTYPTGQFEYAAKAAESNRLDIDGNKAGYVSYGVEIVNQDEDWAWTPGDRVYLGEGGGYTTTAPSDTGDLIQVVGRVLPDGESFMLDVDNDWEVSA